MLLIIDNYSLKITIYIQLILIHFAPFVNSFLNFILYIILSRVRVKTKSAKNGTKREESSVFYIKFEKNLKNAKKTLAKKKKMFYNKL